jgi:hypothetical protein
MNELYCHVAKGGLEECGKIDFSKRTIIRSIEVVCVLHEKWKMTWTYWIGPHSHWMQILSKFLGAIEIKASRKEDL